MLLRLQVCYFTNFCLYLFYCCIRVKYMLYLSWTSFDLEFGLHLRNDTNITFDRYFSSLNPQFYNFLIKIKTSQSFRILLIIEQPITIKIPKSSWNILLKRLTFSHKLQQFPQSLPLIKIHLFNSMNVISLNNKTYSIRLYFLLYFLNFLYIWTWL